jgi:hypothetical protein
MNRWYVAALIVVVGSAFIAVALPPIEQCTALPGAGPGINECGGLQISPAFVVVVGTVLAASLSLIGFLRSTR